MNSEHAVSSVEEYELVEVRTDEDEMKNVDGDLEKGERSSLDELAGPTEKEILPTDAVPLRVWLILLISSVGVLMASISTTALVIAFPTLLQELNMTISTMMWVLLIVFLMIGAIVPAAGKFGDMFGQAAVYKAGYVCFVAGCLGAGFVDKAHQGYDLLVARIVIGFGCALLFTNSNAILTNAFAPYKKVGLSQGIFQLSVAMGTVFGPLIGGGLSNSQWRWIFWFNVPVGGSLCILAFFVVQEIHKNESSQSGKLTLHDKMMRFDYLGAFSCSFGLVLILIAMIQAVSPDPTLSQPGSIAGLVLSGCFCGAVFIIDQYYATDPLIPPSIFHHQIFTVTTISGACLAFVRNSITFNMIFFLQGPLGKTPLEAGIALIPYGLGIMFTGFLGGAISDKVGIRNMAAIGPLITAAGCATISQQNSSVSLSVINGVLFVCGMGMGLFQSPNSTANMLSVDPQQRGVAAAIGMLVMTFCQIVGIVLTFSLVLNYLTQEELFNLFIYGGGSGVDNTLQALAIDFYALIASCVCGSFCVFFFLPPDINKILHDKIIATSPSSKEISSTKVLLSEKEKDEDDYQEPSSLPQDIETMCVEIDVPADAVRSTSRDS